MKQSLWIIGFFFFFTSLAFSQQGHEIKVKIDNFQEKELYLGYYLQDKQYLLDTTQLGADGYFTFSGDGITPGGLYLIVMPPDNQYFQLLIDDKSQRFSMHCKNPKNPTEGMEIKGSEDNKLFYDYLNYLSVKRPEAASLQEAMDNPETPEKKKADLQEKLDKLNQEVMDYQANLIKKYPTTLTAVVIKSNLPLDVPEIEGEDQRDIEVKKWQYAKQHYFDNLDLADPRMLRTPFLFQRLDHYVNKMTVQHPDSINQSLYYLLEKMKPSEETFKYYLIHFLNTYAKSQIVGFDAIYVFLADTYYASGQAPWTEEEQLTKIIENATRLEPLLIGKIAPNIKMQTQDNKEIWLHDFQSPYTVLFIWDPDCGHCKKSMPQMIEFYNNYKDKGVEVFAICTKLYDELQKCWDTIEERGMGIWFNSVDPYNRSKFRTIYDVKTTPQIYILDYKKEILSKRIGAEQLGDVMDQILKMQEHN
ncbi:MAG: redoxin domain-containing protein [Saprospirales bacterium]|nr:redoxin domain-containing protein [Saprospirales bacterium]MBK8492052.1 redoxin domain-containing protein [Saprospirales bacterium]